MSVRTLLPVLLLAATSLLPAVHAVGGDAEVQVSDLPASVPPDVYCLSDEPAVVPFVAETADCLLNCICPPIGPALLAYLDELRAWAVAYGATLAQYGEDLGEYAQRYADEAEAFLAWLLLHVNAYAIELEQWLVCRLVSPVECGPMPVLALPPPPPTPQGLPPQPPLPPDL